MDGAAVVGGDRGRGGGVRPDVRDGDGHRPGYGDVKLVTVIAGRAGYGSPTAAALAVLAWFLTASIAALALEE